MSALRAAGALTCAPASTFPVLLEVRDIGAFLAAHQGHRQQVEPVVTQRVFPPLMREAVQANGLAAGLRPAWRMVLG